MKLRHLIATALLAALICVIAPWLVPIGPVPITLATFAVYIAGAVGGKKLGVLAVVIYVLLGTCGVPVFAGFIGGFQAIAGPTGGYLLGYIPCALIVGAFVDKSGRRWAMPLSMLLGTIALYALGTCVFMLQTGKDLASSLMLCVVPFLLFDAVKIALASVVGNIVRPRTQKFLGK